MDCTTLTPTELAARRLHISAEHDAWLDQIARALATPRLTHPPMERETIGDEAELRGWDLYEEQI